MDMMWYRRRGLMVTPHIESVTGSIASFNSDYNKIPVKSLICDIEPIQDGTGDPSPENVRPISGWTGANVTRTGVNVLNLSEWETESNSGITIGTDNISIVNVGYQENLNRYNVLNRSVCMFSFRVKTVNLNDSKAAFSVYADGIKLAGSGTTGAGNITLDSIGTEKDITLTVPNGTEYISFGGWAYGGNVQISNIQLELGSTATDYEPYKGSTYSVNWQTEAGTVYGGTLDVVSGKLTVDSVLLSFDGTEAWYLISSNAYLVLWNKPPSISNDDLNQISNYLTGGGNNYMIFGKYRAQTNGAIVIGNTTNSQAPYTYKWKTVEEFKAYLAEHPLQVCYKIATPTEIQLTPQEVKTLLGENNIWCDSGNVSVNYWKWGK